MSLASEYADALWAARDKRPPSFQPDELRDPDAWVIDGGFLRVRNRDIDPGEVPALVEWLIVTFIDAEPVT